MPVEKVQDFVDPALILVADGLPGTGTEAFAQVEPQTRIAVTARRLERPRTGPQGHGIVDDIDRLPGAAAAAVRPIISRPVILSLPGKRDSRPRTADVQPTVGIVLKGAHGSVVSRLIPVNELGLKDQRLQLGTRDLSFD